MVRLPLQSQYARALSQSVRTERFRRKRKSLPVTQQQQQPPKRFSISKNIVTDISDALPEEEFNKHVVELQKEWRSQRCNASHIDMLFKETFCNRRQWLPLLSTGRLAPILEKFPCFEEGYYVSNEMKFLHINVAPLVVWLIRISFFFLFISKDAVQRQKQTVEKSR